MKAWMLALSLVAVLGFTGLADAKGAKHGHGIKGTVSNYTPGATTFQMTIDGKKNPNAGKTVTVTFDPKAVTGGTLAMGSVVRVAGTLDATNLTVNATAVTIGHAHKKKAA